MEKHLLKWPDLRANNQKLQVQPEQQIWDQEQ